MSAFFELLLRKFSNAIQNLTRHRIQKDIKAMLFTELFITIIGTLHIPIVM